MDNYMQTIITVALTLIGTLLSVGFGAWINNRSIRKRDERVTKLDVLKRLMSYRFVLSDEWRKLQRDDSAELVEFHCALNEVVIVFHSNKDIISILKSSWDGCEKEKLNRLLEKMCDELRIPITGQPNFI